MNFKNLALALSLISSLHVCAQEKSNGFAISLNMGIGNTNVRTFSNLYPILTPRISYQKNRFAYGIETNRFRVNSEFRVRDFGVFARYYTRFKYLHLLEAKVNRGLIKGSDDYTNYYSFAVSPGWEWETGVVKKLYFQGLIDFYYRECWLLQHQVSNVTLRCGLNYKL